MKRADAQNNDAQKPACNRGSAPEVVEHGVTGYIVEDERGAMSAVARLHALSRDTVRTCFDACFTAKRMAEDYLSIYRSLMGEQRSVLRVIR